MPGAHKEIDWRTIRTMGAVAALFMPLGSWLLVSEAIYRRVALGLLVGVGGYGIFR